MSEFVIKKASKKAKKLRLGLSASSGFGKTYSALLLAYGLCDDWNKICIIDTERDSASLYADLGPFSTLVLTAPYSPERYIEAITAVEKAGFEVIIVDSITHEWNGSGGCLEIHSNLGGRFQDWGNVTPRHSEFINKILTSSAHVITTVRRKQDHEIVKENGKTTVQKLGLKEETRDGFEYELDINFEILNANHMVKASKDRTGLFTNTPEFKITSETGKLIKQWCESGRSNLDEALELIRIAKSEGDLKPIYLAYRSELGEHSDFNTALKKRSDFFKEVKTETK